MMEKCEGGRVKSETGRMKEGDRRNMEKREGLFSSSLLPFYG